MRFGRLLAEAVTRYAAELEKLAATDPAAAADRMSLRAGGVMDRADGGGAAGAGTSGRPWVLSRMHERGDQTMRKVVTGEELAQIYNPDPFAMPRWRAPVYRTPFGIILVAKLFKLLAWIVRMVARHPLAASVLAAGRGDLGQARLGHPGRPGPGRRRHADRLAVVLAGLVLPVGRPPGPGQVAHLVLPPPLGRGDDDRRGGALVSGPDPAARARQGHRHPVHRPGDRSGWSPGQSAADFANCAENLAHGFGALLCRVRTARSGAVVLEFIRRDALAALVPALPIPDHPDLKALPVGRREDGLPWLVKLHGTHVLIAGATGAGKASLLWGLVRAMFPLMQDGLVRILAADPKLMELAYGRVIFDSYGAYAADPAAIAAMLDQAVADMQDRAGRFAGRQRDHTPTIEDPFTVVLVDEVAFLTAYQPDRKPQGPDHVRAGHPDHPGPGGRLLRGGRVAGPAQGRADHPEPVPRPDRHAAR